MTSASPDSQDASAHRRTPRAGRDLPAAIITGVVLVAIVVLTVFWWHWGFVIFIAVMLILGAVELHRAMQGLGMRSAIVPILVGTAIIVLGSFAASSYDLGIGPNTFLIAAVGMTAVAALMWRLPGGAKGFVGDAAASLFTIAYLPLMGCFIPLMMGDDLGTRRILSWMLCVIASDTGGYAVGVLLGRHPMAPRISPKKSWEGMIGSIVLAMAVGAGCTVWLLGAPPWTGLILGGVLSVVGTCGDLVESMIKRDIGIKDMSNFLPGHGGVMDRLDSMLLSAPFAWAVLSVCL
ncbi:phosphatidate cytidylyltransferase [Acidipropionibacterium virtanenii]|uniref:Phosphatidate cytidylyltransferase n=1 Tax=Acidipropionibacterium virtanenii TaxID=2057246 RepID=A0A344UT66_9ACTN|nr:phosphatidate cytidylyltransferase [Acidipropionibacterium virtanenii]AXE38464.1 Phosphatidate cytidylyltransferase [Acidipropionibacterium virtanenii]